MRKHGRGSDTKPASVAFKSMVRLIYRLKLLLPRAKTYGAHPTGQTLPPGLPGDSLRDPRHLFLPEGNSRDRKLRHREVRPRGVDLSSLGTAAQHSGLCHTPHMFVVASGIATPYRPS